MTKKDRLEESCKNYNPDMELNSSGNQDYGHLLAESLSKKRELKDLEERAEIDDAIQFVELTNKQGLNPDDVFSNPYEKARFLQRIKGNKTLKTKGQKYKEGERGIPFSRASHSQIGKAFKSTYYSDLNRINKYKNK